MSNQNAFSWAVVGAGPAGIAAVGKLIDHGVPPKEIAWFDPHFRVGDFNQFWSNVPSNTKAQLFIQFLEACQAFRYSQCDKSFALQDLDHQATCELRYMVEPLQWISDHLKQSVQAIESVVQSMVLKNRHWEMAYEGNNIVAKNVILAMGAEPKTLSYSETEILPLKVAMDKEKIKQNCSKEDRVAVFGSSHSAILAIRNLIECGVGSVINFFQSPLLYALYLEDWILFDDTGLKGTTAQWARDNIDGQWPASLQRYVSAPDQIEQHLPQCNKVVYAVGFQRRHLPIIEGVGSVQYDPRSGIIAPGLFGFGIAFPEAKDNPFGKTEYRVGLWKFMDYLNRVMPVWLKYGT